MRRVALLGVLLAAVLAAPGIASAAKPILGVTGNTDRFLGQTAQDSLVDEAFLGWGQGVSYGVPFQNTFASLGPIPMIHLGTNAQGSLTKAAITPGGIAAGLGDGYLIALNNAIAQWGRAIYVRPMAEMNNAGNLWSGYNANGTLKDAAHSPENYRKAFARIYLLVHGGTAAAIDAKLKALGMPALRGGDLPVNPFPRVRVLWSPLAGGNPQIAGNAPENYYPGDAYVDVGGGDIYDEAGGTPPWSKFDDLYTFALAHHKPFSVPEWGLFGVDDPTFVQDMCDFLKQHGQTETSEFYESKPGTIFDLDPKPLSRHVYSTCITPLAAGLPSWAENAPGNAKQLTLKLIPDPDTGDSPLAVNFAVVAKLSVPIVQWQVVFGDGQQAGGSGTPPATLDHTYKADGVYQATLVVYQSPPFTGTAIRFLTTAMITVGTGSEPLISLKTTPSTGKAPVKVVYQIDTNLPRPVTSWQLVFGDGLSNQGTGKPPHFAGHTYTKPGTYQAILIVYEAPPFTGTVVRFYTVATITVS
jgi:hypothetical protein